MMLKPLDDDDDCGDMMSRSTTRKTVHGFIGDLSFNYGMFRTFGNSRGQSVVKALRMWRGEEVYIMPQKIAFVSPPHPTDPE